MMPGIVAAGAIRPPVATGVTILADGGFAYPEDFVPQYPSVIPGASPAQNAAGELLRVSWTTEGGGSGQLFLIVRGVYATPAALPFAQMVVDGTTVFLRSAASVTVIGNEATVRWATGASPIPDGTHKLVFQ